MNVKKGVLILAAVFSLQWPCLQAACAPKRVLVIDSFGRNVSYIGKIISAFEMELTSLYPEPIDLHVVSLEMTRFAEAEQEVPFVNFLAERFSENKPDLVVPVGGPACTFLARHRDTLFAASPVLLAGVAEQVLHTIAVPGNAGVVPLRVNLHQMIEDILQVLPATDTIYVIMGSSAIETFWLRELRYEFSSFSNRVQFTYLTDLRFQDLRSRISALPENSAVLFGLLIVDAGGTLLDPNAALATIVKEAKAPVFCFHESFFGTGTVGGRFLSEREAGSQAAKAAVRILKGEQADRVRVAPFPQKAPVYDWRALQRWSISESRLPQGSTLRFRPPSPFVLYRSHIAWGIALSFLLGVLITRLLLQKRSMNQAERKLVESEQMLRMITDALPVLIAYIDSDGRYRFSNDAYTAWFGVNPQWAVGRTIREVVGERFHTSIMPYVERALSGEYVHFTLDIDMGGGRLQSVDSIYVPDKDEHGRVRGIYVLVLDVTERNTALRESKRLQDELLHTGRISTMAELAAAIAHEINQPLSAIMSNAQAARHYLNAPESNLDEVREIIDDIVKDDERAGNIINRLRTLLKTTEIVFEPVDLNAILREVTLLLHSGAVIRDIKVSLDLDRRVPMVYGDRVQLQQVSLNLMLNAFEAMNEVPRWKRRVVLSTSLDASGVRVAVKDSGKGIAMKEAEAIFKPFYTSKPDGLGMGLYISSAIITRHQGRIWCESNPDGGATFYFCLPVCERAKG